MKIFRFIFLSTHAFPSVCSFYILHDIIQKLVGFQDD